MLGAAASQPKNLPPPQAQTQPFGQPKSHGHKQPSERTLQRLSALQAQ